MKHARPTSYTGRKATQTITGDVKLSVIEEEATEIATTISTTIATDILRSTIIRGDTTLVAGTVTVPVATIAATDTVLITRTGHGASAIGFLETIIAAGTGFTVNSLDATGTMLNEDGSTLKWIIIKNV